MHLYTQMYVWRYLMNKSPCFWKGGDTEGVRGKLYYCSLTKIKLLKVFLETRKSSPLCLSRKQCRCAVQSSQPTEGRAAPLALSSPPLLHTLCGPDLSPRNLRFSPLSLPLYFLKQRRTRKGVGQKLSRNSSRQNTPFYSNCWLDLFSP